MIVSIDPGIKGAAAALLEAGRGFVDVIDLPTTGVHPRTMVDAAKLAAWMRPLRPRRVVIEGVHSMPKQGISSTFKFGVAVGICRAVSTLILHGETPEFVDPNVWKEYFDLIGCDKDESRSLAAKLFPDQAQLLERVKDQHRAEAMLIGWWADRPVIGKNWR